MTSRLGVLFLFAIGMLVVEGAVCPANSPPVRPLDQLVGGRGVQNCQLTCLERVTYSLYCYSDVGIGYDIYWWVLFPCFVFGFVWSVYCLVRVNQHYSEMGKRLSCTKPRTTQVVVTFSILAATARIIYMVDTFNGKTSDVVFLGAPFNDVLGNFAQCLLAGQLLLVVLVWKKVVDSVKTFKMISNSAANLRLTLAAIIILVGVAVPCKALGYIVAPIFGTVGGVIIGGSFAALLVGGIWYSCTIRKILKDGISDVIKLEAVKRIQYTLMIQVVLGSVAVIFTVFFVIKVSSSPWYFLLSSDALIRLCEFALIFMCASSVSHKARFAISTTSNAARTRGPSMTNQQEDSSNKKAHRNKNSLDSSNGPDPVTSGKSDEMVKVSPAAERKGASPTAQKASANVVKPKMGRNAQAEEAEDGTIVNV